MQNLSSKVYDPKRYSGILYVKIQHVKIRKYEKDKYTVMKIKIYRSFFL